MVTMASLGSAALQEARALGHGACGEEHLLLAWLASDLPPHERHHLDGRGLTADAARAALAATGPDPALPSEAGGWTRSAPSWHTALGRATGLSLAADRLPPPASEVARASVWEGGGRAAALLAAMGATRDDVLAVTGALPASRPDEILLPLAETEAVAVEDGWVGDTHVLLALLAGRPDSLAAAVLGSCGITYDRMAASHDVMRAGPPPGPRADPASPAAPSPACRAMLGRAQGLAAASGAGSVRSEHALLAWLWEDDGQAVALLEHLGTTAPAALDALAAAGATVPGVDPPEPDRRAWGERVAFPPDRLPEVRAGMVRALRPGDWGWNVDSGTAWVIAVSGIDLHALVDDLLSRR